MSELVKIKQIDQLTESLASKAIDSQVVKIANNLSDVNAGTARTNLSIYSKSEVDSIIVGAKDAYNVADISTRNALTGLKVTDRVFVNDDGDGKWALYLVTAVTNGQGSTSTYKKIADEDLFSNALTAAAVKAAYESNADTYAFSGAYKSKLDKITVAGNVNLDNISATADAANTTANNALSTANNAASSAATAQNTANTANSAAAAAQSTANNASSAATTAQNTANSANSAAANAQSTANSANTAAASAQSAATAANSAASAAQDTANTALTNANSAISIANAKQFAFTEATEYFTGIGGAPATNIDLALSHPIKAGFEVMVFFNGVRVKVISWHDSIVTFRVPYLTEASDDLIVNYAY